MIFIERNQADENGVTIMPNECWFHRASAATDTALEEGANCNIDRNIYAHDEVKKALERLFHDKCAYCESKMTATSDWDVEHFRPKGGVAEREDHPGYYWLAYTWENLYPSCQHCNQSRKDRPRWADDMDLPAGGKVDRFPLLNESARAMGPEDDTERENPLLIDPCRDDPEEYLGYDPTGQIFALCDNVRGCTTIDVLHLKRRRLRDFRRETIKSVSDVLKLIGKAADSNLVDDLEAWIKRYQAPSFQHAGVSRYVAQRPAEFGA